MHLQKLSLTVVFLGLVEIVSEASCQEVAPSARPADQVIRLAHLSEVFAPCGHDCCAEQCRCQCCQHCSSVSLAYLLLHPTGADMTYALPQAGLGAPGTVPIGAAGTADPNHDSGFRVGFQRALDDNTSIGLAYTWFESNTFDFIASPAGPAVLDALAVFPGTRNAGAAAQTATANYGIDFQFIDLDYRVRVRKSENYAVNVIAGLRYGNLDQDFIAVYNFAAPDGVTTVGSEIDFDGFGLRFGVDGERHMHRCSALRVYGRSFASVLAGEFRGDYRQDNQFNGREVTVSWDDDRLVPVLETELGLAWRNRSNRLQLSVGYQMSAWFNVVSTPEWIDHVKQTNFVGVKDSIYFDGVVSRLEWNW